MDTDELRTLLLDVESDRSERTISTDKQEKFGEAICAFANDLANHTRPGYLFVGAKPDGSASGADITDRLLQTLAAFRSDGNILPAPVINVEKKELGGGEMAVVEVFPSSLPPVRYNGVVWVRVGPRKARATEADERVLFERRAALARTWDARACARADISDLAMGFFEAYKVEAIARDVLEENHRPLEHQLASLRFWDRRTDKPTNAAVVLFGKDVIEYFPGAFVQYVQYQGDDASSPVIRERRFMGDFQTILRELSSLSDEVANTHPVVAGPLREVSVHEYPPVALREVLVNAIVHRDYESNSPVRILQFSERIEVHNPGGLYGDIRIEDFPGATAYRNPVLAEAAKTLGYVNRFGRGVPRIQDAMKKNGSADPEFFPAARHFLVTLRKRP